MWFKTVSTMSYVSSLTSFFVYPCIVTGEMRAKIYRTEDQTLAFIEDLGCILLGLFGLFLFRFRNNIIHGISISKRTLLHVSDLEMESEVT